MLPLASTLTLALWPPRSPAQRTSSPRMRLANEAETCRRVAAMRAIETADGCGAFSDHLASLFAGEEQLERARAFRALQPNPRDQIDAVSLRCLAVDERVLSACRGEAGIRQVLCLGCGMDSRPHRLDLPGVAWFEVDVPEVIALKEELLRTASPEAAALTVGRVERLGLDLGRELHGLPPALRAVGWDPEVPTLSILEGVAFYLFEAELVALHSALPAGAGSRAVVTSITNEMAMCHKDEDNQRRYAYLRPLAAMWRSSDPTLRHVLGLPSSAWRVVRASGLRTGEAAARGLRVKPPAELLLPAGADELVLDLALQSDLELAAELVARDRPPPEPEAEAAARVRIERMSTDAANRGWVAVFAPLAAYAVLGFGAYAAGLAGVGYALQALAQTLLGGGATP